MARLRGFISETSISVIEMDCKPFFISKPGSVLYRGSNDHVSSFKKKTSRLNDRIPRDTNSDLHDELNFYFRRKFGWNVRNGVFASSSYTLSSYFGDYCYIFIPVGKFEYVWSPVVNDLYRFQQCNKLFSQKMMKKMYDSTKKPLTDMIYTVNDAWADYIIVTRLFGLETNDIRVMVNKPPKELKVVGSQFFPNFGLKNGEYATVYVCEPTFEEWVETYRRRYKVYFPNEIVDEYIDYDLNKAVKSRHEISFKCDEYYLIHPIYENELIKIIKKYE